MSEKIIVCIEDENGNVDSNFVDTKDNDGMKALKSVRKKEGGIKKRTVILVIKPIRKVSEQTGKEKLILNIYKCDKTDIDLYKILTDDKFDNKTAGKPDIVIETDIFNLGRALPEINLYGLGLLPKELKELRLCIEQHYRRFCTEKYKDYSISYYIDDIAKELYEKCIEINKRNSQSGAEEDKNKTDESNTEFPEKGNLCYIPVTIFNRAFIELYDDENKRIDYDFDNRTVRREMESHGFTKCNTPEYSYYCRVSGTGQKYIAFKKDKICMDSSKDTVNDGESQNE